MLHLLGHLIVQSDLVKTAPSLEINPGLVVLFDVDWIGCDVEVVSHLKQPPPSENWRLGPAVTALDCLGARLGVDLAS